MVRPAQVFVLHAHADMHLADELKKHLDGIRRAGLIKVDSIEPGDKLDPESVSDRLSSADFVLPLVSAALLASDDLREPMLGQPPEKLLPVWLRPCLWPPDLKQPLLKKAVTSFEERDKAWLQVTLRLSKEVREWRQAVRRPRPPDWPADPPGQEDQSPLVLVLYAHQDEDHSVTLEDHLAPLVQQKRVRLWSVRHMTSGDTRPFTLHQQWEQARSILLLVTRHLLSTVPDVIGRALDRHEARRSQVIPVIVDRSDWAWSPLGCLRPLPTSRIPILAHRTPKDGWVKVIHDLPTVLAVP